MSIKPHQIRDMKVEDIRQSLADSQEALLNYQFQFGTGQLENYKAMANTKKDIARYKTILKEMELGISKKKSSKK